MISINRKVKTMLPIPSIVLGPNRVTPSPPVVEGQSELRFISCYSKARAIATYAPDSAYSKQIM